MKMIVIGNRRSWWSQAVRGFIALLFGLGAIVWPHITLIALVFLFGAFVLLDGIFAAIAALVERGLYRHWWIILLEGLVGIAVGVITFFLPHITPLVLLYLIAVWAFATGIFKIVASIQLRKIMKTDWLLIVSGIASLIFGVLLAIQPAAGAMALLWLIGAYAIILGVFLLFRALWLRQLLTASEAT